MSVFKILKERGFISSKKEERTKHVTSPVIEKILQQKKVTCYIGFDPSASSFHVGNLVQIMVLAHMQREGHRPIAIVGGGTGLIGDPSGKTEMRQMLTLEKIKDNMEKQKKQFTRFLDFSEDKALMINNADWLAPINYIEFLRDTGRHFSINKMLSAESVKQRLETGLSFLEFNYMLLQAYDFLYLFQNHDCILQMGGADQWGNICSGIDLVRRVEQKEAYGITFPLITTSSGQKMGKTEKGAVWLDDDLLSPYEYYQFWRNVDDRDVERFLGLFTFLPMSKVRKLGKLEGSKINEAKEILAYEATKLNHGEEAANKSRESAHKFFSQGASNVADNIAISTIAKEELEKGILAIDLFQKVGLVPSKSEAKRLIKGGGAYINLDKIDKIDHKVSLNYLDEHGEILLRKGKKKYAKLKVE